MIMRCLGRVWWILVTVLPGSFVRSQVLDSAGTVVGLSNPVWLLRSVPPGGIPAPRLS